MLGMISPHKVLLALDPGRTWKRYGVVVAYSKMGSASSSPRKQSGWQKDQTEAETPGRSGMLNTTVHTSGHVKYLPGNAKAPSP